MTLEKQQLVQNAALDGHYQIVCRQLFAALNSWYITLVDVEDWEWEINEYRIFVGTREPPMIDEMNDYSVYYCGYNYYFIDNDGTVKRVVNVNFTEYGEQYTSFLKCSKIQTDYLYSNETGFIQVKDSLELDKNLKVHGTATIDHDTEIGGKTLISDDLTVRKSVEISEDLKIGGTTDITGNTSLSADLKVKGNLTGSKDATFDKNVSAGVQVKAPKVLVDTVARTSGTDNISFENGISTTGGLVVDKSAQIKTNLDVLGESKFTKDVKALADLSIDGDLRLKGDFINTGNIKAEGEMEATGDLKSPGISTDKIYKFSGTGNIKVLNGLDITGSVDVSETTKTKNLTVTNNASMASASVSGALSVSGNLNVSGAINGLKIRVV